MKRKTHVRIATAVVALIGALITSSTASAVGPCCLFCQKGRCNVEVDVEEVEVKGFDVECEAVCIPPLRFPWECGPLKKCGKVRCVKKLVGDKKTTKVCTYDWEAIVCCPDCRSKLRRCKSSACGSSCCDSDECGNGGCDDCVPACGPAGCCAATTAPTTRAGVEGKSAADQLLIEESVEVAEVMVAEFVPAEMTVALVNAIGEAKPDSDGWVRVSNLSSGSLSASGELLE